MSSAVERCPTGTAVLAAAPQVEWKFSPRKILELQQIVMDENICVGNGILRNGKLDRELHLGERPWVDH